MSKETHKNIKSGDSRHQVIVRTSIVGILANVLLAGFKAVVGMLSHSIAITLDAVNNLSDALSSIITIVGTKLAGKRPDNIRWATAASNISRQPSSLLSCYMPG